MIQVRMIVKRTCIHDEGFLGCYLLDLIDMEDWYHLLYILALEFRAKTGQRSGD